MSTQDDLEAHPGWVVIGVLPDNSTGLNGDTVAEIEIRVQNWETGKVLGATGADARMALAMINHLISSAH